jgi:hypothetical protein
VENAQFVRLPVFPLRIYILTRLQQWKDICIAVAKSAYAKELLQSDKVDKITVEEATVMRPWAPVLLGGNSRSSGDRFRALGWESNGKGFLESLPQMIEVEVAK